MTEQLSIDDAEQPVPTHRVQALAGVLAGFRWPTRGTFERLTKPQKQLALEVAEDALRRLAEAED